MSRKSFSTALLLLIPLAMAPVACSDRGADRAALRKDELNRDLSLALQKDTAPATFQDTALGDPPTAAAEPDPGPVEAPRPSTTPARAPETRPAPKPTRPYEPPPRREPAPPTPAPAPAIQPEAPAPTPARAEPSYAMVPMGTTFAATLDQEISTEANQPGDAFTARLTSALTDADGNVLIPAGATVHGRVTAVNRSNHVGETAVIKLALESISYGDQSYPLQATVVEANPQRRNRTTTSENVKKVGIGAAAGAVLGSVLGHGTKGALKGAVLGAAAGTAVAMGTADVDAVLPVGSQVVIRTDSPVKVARR